MSIHILYEDKAVLVCRKPAGLATQSGKIGQKDLVSELKNYLGNNPYLGVIHRLDQPVEGLLVFAKSPSAAKKLSAQLTENMLNKQYYAVVCGQGFKEEKQLENYLVKDNKANMSRVTVQKDQGAKKSVLVAKCLEYRPKEDISLMEIKLLTGRHHQIRVQMAAAGLPLLGDVKYGGEKAQEKAKALRVKNVALCAYALSFQNPESKKIMEFTVKPEGEAFGYFLM